MNELRPECRRLAAELRTLRTRARLSMAALAAGSTYSKSSWERYLNAKALPPWSAVSSLCALAEEPEPRLRVLWEQAESAWSGREVTMDAAAKGAGSEASAQVGGSDGSASASASAYASTSQGAGASTSSGRAADDGQATGSERGGSARRSRRGSSPLIVLTGVAFCAALITGAAYELTGGAGGGSRAAAASAPTPGGAFHVGCSGRACQGADPTAMLCGVQPQSLPEFQTALGPWTQIRYNPLCQAAWIRLWSSEVGDVLSISVPGGPTTSVHVPDVASSEDFLYTPMVWVGTGHAELHWCLTPPAPGTPECHDSVLP